MKQGTQVKIIKASIEISIYLLAFIILMSIPPMASFGCGAAVVKREFVMSGSARHQALVDSLNTQIRDCENALGLHEKAKGREFE